MSRIVSPAELEESAKIGIEIRRRIHEEPELGLSLVKTQEKILSALKSFGIEEVTANVGGPEVNSVVAVVRGDKPGRTIGLRADADALPLTEITGLPWASRTEGKMHACGHDGHVATLLTALHYLQNHRDFAGTVVGIFQPGEEGYAGARYMIEDDLVERFGIDEFYALHADPMVDAGSLALISGFGTANADMFKITFEGVGGHGSRPHLAKDPVLAASHCVLSLQTIVSRNVAPDEAAVISVGFMQAGSEGGPSVIPQTAKICGTTRTYESEVQEKLIERMQKVVESTAQMFDMKGTLEYTKLYPAMFNSPAHVEECRRLLEKMLGAGRVGSMKRRPGGEDFSFMLQKKPGCLFRLGTKDGDHTAGVHNPAFDFNDKAMATGAAALVTIALNRAASEPIV